MTLIMVRKCTVTFLQTFYKSRILRAVHSDRRFCLLFFMISCMKVPHPDVAFTQCHWPEMMPLEHILSL
jgi:hypothetical protein